MHNTYSQPCSPLTFTYTTRDQQQTRSVQSSHTQVTLQRINQIRPKSKIVIPPKIKKHQSSSAKPKISIPHTNSSTLETSPTRTPQKIVQQTLEYQKIRPKAFKWNKFGLLCGSQSFPLGENGCLCTQPCKWKKQWTKHQGKTDYSTFTNLLNEQPKAQYLSQIEKDLLRTYPQCPTFACNTHYHQMLKNVLVAYSIYDIPLGYVQGLNMIAGVLLYHIKNPGETFWALADIMQYQQLRMIYLDQFKYLKIHQAKIMNIVQRKLPDLFSLIEELDVIPECFLNGWLLSLMSNCIPIEYMPEVIDRFMTHGWNFIYQLIVTYLLYLKQRLLFSNDQAEFLQYLSTQAGKQVGSEWPQLVASSAKVIL